MRLYKVLLLFLLFSSFSLSTRAQTLKSYLSAAETSFESKDYGSALFYYLSANQFEEK
ncbi:MAG: hypothetical protein R2771_10625 [Saprospiraceae bacterium]